MLVDEIVIPLLIKATESFDWDERPAALDQQKATGSSQTTVLYGEIFLSTRHSRKNL
jgi:hypothetical protein